MVTCKDDAPTPEDIRRRHFDESLSKQIDSAVVQPEKLRPAGQKSESELPRNRLRIFCP